MEGVQKLKLVKNIALVISIIMLYVMELRNNLHTLVELGYFI